MAVRKDVQERVEKALQFEAVDRAPIWEALEHRGLYAHLAPGAPFPQCAAIACERLGIDATYACMEPAEERGQGHVVAGDTVWYSKPVFRSLAELRSFRPGNIDERAMEEELLAEHEARRSVYEPHTMYLPQNGGWGFLPGYDTETFEVVAAAMAEDVGALARYWDWRMEAAIVRNTITARHRLAPVVQCCEDVAGKTGLLVHPEVLREHFFPRFARVVEPLRRAGIKVIWHSDGNITSVLDNVPLANALAYFEEARS